MAMWDGTHGHTSLLVRVAEEIMEHDQVRSTGTATILNILEGSRLMATFTKKKRTRSDQSFSTWSLIEVGFKPKADHVQSSPDLFIFIKE